MTERQLRRLEAKLKKKGYKKWTCCLTSSESWAWFKSFAKQYNSDGEVISGYQVAFRVWDYTKYGEIENSAYGFDFWTSPIGCDKDIYLTSRWDPICNLDIFEKIAADFHNLTEKYFTNINK